MKNWIALITVVTVLTFTLGCDIKPPQKAQKAPAQAAPATGEETLVKAAPGVTGKGQFVDSAEKPMSIVTVPLGAYFAAKEMAVFEIQIPQALTLYKATNDRTPQSQEEFMNDIVKANNIALPQLKPGDTYVYDVKNATLMVKTKK